jgi:ribose-phosphate pyrophosphokinase
MQQHAESVDHAMPPHRSCRQKRRLQGRIDDVSHGTFSRQTIQLDVEGRLAGHTEGGGVDEKPRAISLVGEVRGKRVILIDDEIATAGTMVQAAEFVRAEGARRVTVAGVHAVLSGAAPERLRTAAVDDYVFTDSIPIPEHKWNSRITVLSVSELLAEAIMRIHDGRSVSALFA